MLNDILTEIQIQLNSNAYYNYPIWLHNSISRKNMHFNEISSILSMIECELIV